MGRKEKDTPKADDNYYLDFPVLSSDGAIAVLGMDKTGDKVLYKYIATDSNEKNILWWDFTTDLRIHEQYTCKGEIANGRNGVEQEFLPLAWAMYSKWFPECYRDWVARSTERIAELRYDLNRTQMYCLPAKFNGLDVDEKGRSVLGCLKALQTKADSREVFGYGRVEIRAWNNHPDSILYYYMNAPEATWKALESLYGIDFSEMNIGTTFDQAMNYLTTIGCQMMLKKQEKGLC